MHSPDPTALSELTGSIVLVALTESAPNRFGW